MSSVSAGVYVSSAILAGLWVAAAGSLAGASGNGARGAWPAAAVDRTNCLGCLCSIAAAPPVAADSDIPGCAKMICMIAGISAGSRNAVILTLSGNSAVTGQEMVTGAQSVGRLQGAVSMLPCIAWSSRAMSFLGRCQSCSMQARPMPCCSLSRDALSG